MSDPIPVIYSISHDTFKGMETDSKLNVLFDLAVFNYNQVQELRAQQRSTQMWNWRISAIFGFIGGICAHIAEKIFKV